MSSTARGEVPVHSLAPFNPHVHPNIAPPSFTFTVALRSRVMEIWRSRQCVGGRHSDSFQLSFTSTGRSVEVEAFDF